MEIKEKETKEFQPFDINVTIESPDDLLALLARYRVSRSCITKGLKDSFADSSMVAKCIEALKKEDDLFVFRELHHIADQKGIL